MKINYIFLILAIGLGCGSYFFAMKTSRLINQGRKIEAKVIELSKGSVTNSKGQSSVVYYPVFEYVLSGKSYTQASRVGTNPATFDVGEKTNLYIDPENPSSFISDAFVDKWGIPSVLAFISLVFFMISYFIGRKSSGVRSLHLKGKGRFNLIFVEVTSVTKKENNVYWFEASWTDPLSGRSHSFYIHNSYYATEVFKGKQIEVALNPENYAEYYPVLIKAPKAA
jgi:hypothetical protein